MYMHVYVYVCVRRKRERERERRERERQRETDKTQQGTNRSESRAAIGGRAHIKPLEKGVIRCDPRQKPHERRINP